MPTPAVAKSVRTMKILTAKRRSEKGKARIRLTHGLELFLFENGSLIEYEYALPDFHLED